ncbi:MAG: hypothetical protein KDA65_16980 [Planctomycetaceae bacterium]|nr:hypothetical protein [Planctomycetaceae bacterium]
MNEFRFLSWIAIVFLLFSFSAYADNQNSEEVTLQQFVTGNKLIQKLEEPLTVSWDHAELRTILQQLSATTDVALVIDRRLDPHFPITLSLANRPFLEILVEVGRQSRAELSVQSNYLYLGPPQAARNLRTVIAQKEEELKEALTGVDSLTRRQMTRRTDLIWDDLTTPLEVIRKISGEYTLKLSDSDQIPHDLLTKCHLPSASLSQQLCTLLIQYDLCYGWDEFGKSFRITPFPEDVSLRQQHRVPKSRRDQVERELASHPELKWNWGKNNQLELIGRVEDHEWLISLLFPKRGGGNSVVNQGVKLSLQRFTLKQEGVSVVSVIDELQKSGIEFQFEPAEFGDRFRERKDKVDLNLQEASPEELCQQLFGKLPVKYEVLRDKIVLQPAE